VPIYEFAKANEELSTMETAVCYECCGKDICGGCFSSCVQSENYKCPFCKSMRMGKTDDEKIEELLKRVEVNDAGAIYLLGNNYYHGYLGLQQDRDKAMELWSHAADLGHSQAHCELGNEYHLDGNLKKAKFHYEAAAMAGHEDARNNLGCMEEHAGNKERAVKHWKIAASAGCQNAMCALLIFYEQGLVSRDAIDTVLTAYNNSCAEMRSEARDAYIRAFVN
jgi:TPR repeat protein